VAGNKKPLNPFQHFIQAHRVHTHQSFCELGKLWQQLHPSEKAKYQDMYRKDRQQHTIAKEAQITEAHLSLEDEGPAILQLGPYSSFKSRINPVGEGAYGTVLVMQHVKTRRLCAMKIIRDSRLFDSLETEVNTLNKLTHDCLLPPLNQQLEGPLRWATIQLVPEENLNNFRKNVEQNQRLDFVAIAVQLIHVVQYVNSMGICHCDIKPGNCLFRSSVRHLYLFDFGLSCELPCHVLGHTVYTARTTGLQLWKG
jgi:hypothetical protein